MATATAVALAVAGAAFAQEFSFEFGTPGAPQPERLEGSASSIAIDADGNPWVAELSSGQSRVVKYDFEGEFVAAFTSFGDGRIPVTTPWGIAADEAGFIYVAQGSAEPRVAKLDTGGRLIDTIRLEHADGTTLHPYKLDVDADGRLYVSDGVGTVHVFSATGARRGQIRLFTGQGVSDVTIDEEEVLIAFTTGTPDEGGVARYGLDRRRIGTLGPYGNVSFRELVVDPDDRVIVTDYRNGVARVFTKAGVETGQLGRRGLEPGEMNGPAAIDSDCRGNLYIADAAARYDGPGGPRAGSKVLKFSEPGAAPPPCAPRPPPAGAIDTQINDVEVTQAIQPAFSYTAGPLLAPGEVAFTLPENSPRSRPYGRDHNGAATGEVPLKAHLKTVVRVYANLNRGPAGGIGNIPATLRAVTSSGERLGPIQAIARPPLLRNGDRTVDPAERTTPTGVYTFDLPADWTDQGGSLDLTARVNPAALGCDRQCVNRSTFRLTGVPLGTIRVVPIMPVALNYHGQPPVRDPERAFRLARVVTPLLLRVSGYQAQAEVGDLLDATAITVTTCTLFVFCDDERHDVGSNEFRQYAQGELMDRLERAAEGADLDRCDRVPFGLIRQNNDIPNVTRADLPGAMRGEFLAAGFLPCAIGYAAVHRPLTAVAHELQHAFGRPHAGRACPGTGEGEDQEGEAWPPDDRGLLGGNGLNTITRAVGSRGPHAIVPGAGGDASSQFFDLMSYCGGESSAWISPRGWRNLSNWRVGVASRRAARPGPAAKGRAAPLLRVSAVELPDGELGITGVSPADAPYPAADPASPYVLEAMDQSGSVLAAVGVDADDLDDAGSKLIAGTVPAPPGTAGVFLRRGDEIATRRLASPGAPRVKLSSPKPGSRVTARRMNVRWKASDPDGGKLSARIEYSANGGKSWQGVHLGPAARGRASLPRTLLRGSRNARVRIRVDDGFSQATATSKRFSVAPPPPLVRITDPVAKMAIRADAPLELRGEAVGAGGQPLPGKRLRWLNGRRKLGRGPARSLSSLAPGRHRIVLEASQAGATGRAAIQVKVKAVKPAFLELDAPARLGRKARRATLRVASTVRAKLLVAGKRYGVSPRSRKVRVPVRGKGSAKLRLALVAGKLKTSHALRIPRK